MMPLSEEMSVESGSNCPACMSAWSGQMKAVGGQSVRECSVCGLWFVDAASLGEVDYDEVYDSEYKEEHFSTLENTSDWNEFATYPTYRNFFSEVPRGDGATLLDVGCGVGRFCRAAYSKGWIVKGIDVSSVALEKGRQLAPFPMLSMNLRDLVQLHEKFDVVTAFEVMEHLTDPDAFLHDLKLTVKEGGYFFCTVPNLASPTVRTATRKDWIPPVHVLFFTEKALRELLRRAGFREIRTGVIWTSEAPKKLGPGLAKYYLYRFLKTIPRPDPLGLWACCSM